MESHPSNLFNNASIKSNQKNPPLFDQDSKAGKILKENDTTVTVIDDSITNPAADYFNTLPYPSTKKHIARNMIIFLIKTTNL